MTVRQSDIYSPRNVYTSRVVAILIKDEEADRIVRELAARTGESLTDQ